MIKFKKKPPTLDTIRQWPINTTINGIDAVLHVDGVIEVLDNTGYAVDSVQVKPGTPEQMIKRYKKL